MGASNGFPRDPEGQSSTDHCGCGQSEHCGPLSFHPTLTASVARIQDHAFAHATDGSRSSDRGQHHSVPNGPPPGRGPVTDVFHSSPTHRGAAHVQQHYDEWGPLEENLDPINTPRSLHWDPSRYFIAFASSCDDETYDRPGTDGLRPTDGVSPPLTNTELSLRLQEVHTNNTFTSYLGAVSGRTSLPRNDGPLIQPYHPPNCVARAASAFGQTDPNQTQLSSGSQGRLLIVSENFKYDSMAQHLTPGSNQSNGDSAFPPQMWMTVVPQRPYGRKSDNKKRESILFQVRGRSGITARDAIRKIYAGLEGRDDPVFVDKTSVLMLRLEWPGYLSWYRKIRLNNWKKKPQRIKLEKLATEVVKCIERFIKGAQAVQHPDEVCSVWRVGPQLIEVDRLVLLSLDKVSRGSWQPRIGLLSRDEINASSTPFVC